MEGYCIGLYSEAEFKIKIASTDLVLTVLLLSVWGCTSVEEIYNDIPFLDPPQVIYCKHIECYLIMVH